MFKILIIHTFIIVEELGFSNKTFAYSCLAADSVGRKTSQTSHKTQTNIPTILYDRQTMHLKYSQSDIYTFMRGISVRNLEIFLSGGVSSVLNNADAQIVQAVWTGCTWMPPSFLSQFILAEEHQQMFRSPIYHWKLENNRKKII